MATTSLTLVGNCADSQRLAVTPCFAMSNAGGELRPIAIYAGNRPKIRAVGCKLH
jgi:hypothetical protein